jgi:rubrerythrin
MGKEGIFGLGILGDRKKPLDLNTWVDITKLNLQAAYNNFAAAAKDEEQAVKMYTEYAKTYAPYGSMFETWFKSMAQDEARHLANLTAMMDSLVEVAEKKGIKLTTW